MAKSYFAGGVKHRTEPWGPSCNNAYYGAFTNARVSG